jgi:hypothetical protein
MALPKTGKTVGPEQRMALYSMLSYVPVPKNDSAISLELVKTALPLIVKEANETALSTLAASLPPHISYLLRSKNELLPKDVMSTIAKEMTNTKVTIRRAFCLMTGDVIFAECSDKVEGKEVEVENGVGTLGTDAAKEFAKAVLPALEQNLKTVAASPASGALDGYVALATLLGPFAASKEFGKPLFSPES